MGEIVVEQALFQRSGRQAPRLLARSDGFCDAWLIAAETLIIGFGDRPPGVRCPQAIFAHPLGFDQVAVVRVADQDADQENGLAAGFHFLVMPRPAYERYLGDPFAVAKRLPGVWPVPARLEKGRWPAEPLPARTVQEVQEVLRRLKSGGLPEDEDPEENSAPASENSESPALLGGVQVLVDGGRVVFERPNADSGLIPALWTLLPNSTRSQLWPASFAFGNALAFDALVVPQAREADFPGYTWEEQAAEYPEGRYELNLQIAAESGDQRQLDLLFSRRSWAETWRLGLTLLLVLFFLALASRLLLP